MTKKQFAEEVAAKVGGEVTEVEKANGVVWTGIIVGEGDIRPTVYIDGHYDLGESVNEVVNHIKEKLEKESNTMNKIDATIFENFENVRGMLRARLYNQSTKAEVFRSAAEYGFKDLIIIPYIDEVIPNGSAKVTKQLLDIWDVTEDEVIDIAMSNTTYEMMSMAKALGLPDFMDMGGMYVVTNERKNFGAIGVILGADEIKAKFPNGYVVIPSSIHEVIILDGEEADDDNYITSMIGDVNGAMVAEEERLGNHCYRFVA